MTNKLKCAVFLFCAVILFSTIAESQELLRCPGGTKFGDGECVPCAQGEEGCIDYCPPEMKLVDEGCIPCEPEDNCPVPLKR